MSSVALTEIVPEPASGRVFEHRLLPGIADAGADGRVRLDAIARWLQDVAHLDLRDAGFSGGGVWVVRRTRIRVEGFPPWDEEATVRTFCSAIGRFMAERRTTIRAGDAVVETVAVWVWLDAETLRPARFPAEFTDIYAESAGKREPNGRLRHEAPRAGAEARPWVFRATDVDVAAHVNNSHYWAPLEEELAADGAPGAYDAEIEYRDAAQPGAAVVIADGPMRWIASPEGNVYASIAVG